MADMFVPPVFEELASGGFGYRPAGKQARYRNPWAFTSDRIPMDIPLKERMKHAKPFVMTGRDRAVLRALHSHRVLSREQIEYLFFPNFHAACTRLRHLYQHGFIERIARPSYPTGLKRGPAYRLALRGGKLLAQEDGSDFVDFLYWGKSDDCTRHPTEVSYPFLEHALDLSWFRIAVEKGIEEAGCQLQEWRDEMDIRRAHIASTVRIQSNSARKSESIKLLPDGYFVVATASGQKGHFFVEVDRGSESVKETWRRKILGYKAFFASGMFRQNYAVADTQTMFRVLVTTNSPMRANNLKLATERYGDAKLSVLLLFAPLSAAMTDNPLTTPIWLRGGTTGAQGLL